MANPEFTTEELANEEWRDIPYYEGWYQASNLGRIRRVNGSEKSTFAGRVLRPKGKRYAHCTLSVKGILKQFDIHRLVAMAFYGIRPGLQVDHIDGNRRNNRASNLEYVTTAENHRRAALLGLIPKGKRHHWNRMPEIRLKGVKNPRAKLSETDVLNIRAALITGERGVDLAFKYKVTPTVISSIRNRKLWRHI